MLKSKLRDKFRESIGAIGPIIVIVAILGLTVAPFPSGVFLTFLMGSLLLIAGEMFFSLGAELAMEPMGDKMGSSITKTRNLPLILLVGFLLGFLITISEPDLQVLAEQVPSFPNSVVVLSVAAGVGVFLLLAFLRMIFKIPLRRILLAAYFLVFILALLVPSDFLAVAFDAGGVTTGPMTVPFIMAFGVGISSIRSDKEAAEDSMGLVALCSIGPILTIFILGLIYRTDSVTYSMDVLPDVANSVALGELFFKGLPRYLAEMVRALLPMVLFFALFQIIFIKMSKNSLERIGIGVLYTYAGLVLFLTGANLGFMPAGLYLGQTLAGISSFWILVPIGVLIGYFIVKAEPAVYVLTRQVEALTNGAISGRVLQTGLCLAVAVSVGLAMLRVLTGVSILWIIIPGYLAALALSFFVPTIFTAIAFDSGGVSSGPMTVTFLLPLAIGACYARGGNIVTDAFGVVALVALTPLITLQMVGIIYARKEQRPRVLPPSVHLAYEELDNYTIIEL